MPIGRQHRENLRGLAIQIVGDQFFQHDLIGIAQHAQSFLGVTVAHDAHRQPGAGERMPPDDLLRQAEHFADLAALHP